MKRLKIFHRIMRTTHMYEMLSGFLVYYFITALIIWLVDPNISKFSDSLWLCFATCTTVGFGDVVATSVVSRILTVILTLYGILVTAFIPAVVVNYFLEYNKAKVDESMVVFLDKLENLENLPKEELQTISQSVKKHRGNFKMEKEHKFDKKYLFDKQKELLDTFLSNGAISKEQYDKSLTGLKEKMDIKDDKK